MFEIDRISGSGKQSTPNANDKLIYPKSFWHDQFILVNFKNPKPRYIYLLF